MLKNIMKNNKILLSGGGTMGSVSPLLAVYQEIKSRQPKTEFLFVGTKSGPEKAAVESYKIPFASIPAGKFRRYFAWQNFVDPFWILAGFFQSFKIIRRFKPQAIMIAGAYVGVPLAWAGWLLKVPVLVHQQDIEIGLANKLMAKVAKEITVSFDVSLSDFSQSKKAVLTGNPLRSEFYECDKEKSRTLFDLKSDLPVILITGGGTGSQTINGLVEKALPKITKFAQVIHTTGQGKNFSFNSDNYHQYEFLSHEMPEALCAADLVVSRAGLSTLTELAVTAKPAVIIPLYQTHQELNAQHYQKHSAVVVLSEPGLNPEMFARMLRELLMDKEKLKALSENISKIMPRDGAVRVAEELLGLM
jgi:UDP-N-acetylglucosamine--N-acetylmuramyl-(pentapeptide) pyrophosphoryl-undecaprenol N-acetylglucosamine transferase